MERFYDGCCICTFDGKDSCPEKCFECAHVEALKEDWLHSLGIYFPRFKPEYRTSNWSQAIIKAKKGFIPVISSLGRIVAYYMDKCMAELKPYTITSVPAFRCESNTLFQDFETTVMNLLANSVFANLRGRKYVELQQSLVQTRKKEKRQRDCKTDAQRKRNIQGIYTIQEPHKVKGRNIILLDDVVTSGATMRECANILLKSGAARVIGVALAKTLRLNSSEREFITPVCSYGKEFDMEFCPECGAQLIHVEACVICPCCGYSACNCAACNGLEEKGAEDVQPDIK